MSTESEIKSADVPAGATHVCWCGATWTRVPLALLSGSLRCWDHPLDGLRPIAEAGAAPTTAAPVDQPENALIVGQKMADYIEEQMPLLGGASSEFPGEGKARELLASWRRVCSVPAEQPWKAADPRPAQGGMKPMPDERTQKGTGGLWRKSGIAGGKYLVQRRDGSIPEWPYFVIGAKDPAARAALMAYADEAARLGFDPQYVADIRVTADEFLNYLAEQGQGDPDARPHRKDDPAVVAKMLTGKSV